MSRIIFLEVNDAQSKLTRLSNAIQHHFLKGDNILVLAPHREAATFIEQLLWRLPEEGMIPHCISDVVTAEPVVITTQQENLNQATVLFNLTPGPASFAITFATVYELHKREMTEQRFSEYSNLGITPRIA